MVLMDITRQSGKYCYQIDNLCTNNSDKKLSYRLENRASAACFRFIIMLLWRIWSSGFSLYTVRLGFFLQIYFEICKQTLISNTSLQGCLSKEPPQLSTQTIYWHKVESMLNISVVSLYDNFSLIPKCSEDIQLRKTLKNRPAVVGAWSILSREP